MFVSNAMEIKASNLSSSIPSGDAGNDTKARLLALQVYAHASLASLHAKHTLELTKYV